MIRATNNHYELLGRWGAHQIGPGGVLWKAQVKSHFFKVARGAGEDGGGPSLGGSGTEASRRRARQVARGNDVEGHWKYGGIGALV